MKKLLLLMLVGFIAVAGYSQKEINDPNAQVRNVSGFHAIRVSDAIDLYLSQGNDEVVVVSAVHTKYRERIKTEVENGVLTISYEHDGWHWWNSGNKEMKAYVSFKQLDKLTAVGACDVKVTGVIKSENLDISISGASDFKGDVDVN